MWPRHAGIAALLGRYGLNGQYAPKVAIVGPYNWTDAGAYDNDENTLILHDPGSACVHARRSPESFKLLSCLRQRVGVANQVLRKRPIEFDLHVW